ncbi:MAG: VOC family protein [Terriglobales bacterium]
MANTFGTDILIQAKDPMKAAKFYVDALGFTITDKNPKMIGLHGKNINVSIEPGPPLGPIFEVTVKKREGSQGEAQEERLPGGQRPARLATRLHEGSERIDL